jgi:hypothetical protein
VDRRSGVVEDLALVIDGVDGSVGMAEENLFGAAFGRLANPLEVPRDLV